MSDPETPLEAAARARAELAKQKATPPVPRVIPPPVADPLPYCIYTTVALLAWLVTPPLAVAIFGTLGFVKYARAWRAGLRKSDCVLGDPRWVMLYLGGFALVGAGWTVWWVGGWMGWR